MYNLVRDLGPLYGLGRLTAGTPQVDNASSKTWLLCNLVFLPPHPRPLVSPWAIVAIIIFITFLFVITLWYIVASGSLILNDIAGHGLFSTPHTGPIFMCVVCNLAPCRVPRTTGHSCTWPVMSARSLQLHSRNVCLCPATIPVTMFGNFSIHATFKLPSTCR